MGRVYPVTSYPNLGGWVSVETVYVTEAEHPEIFAKLDELLWTRRKGRALLRELDAEGN